MNHLDYHEELRANIKHLLSNDFILVITATDLETKETHKILRPLPNYEKIIVLFEGDQTYYIGVLGNYKIIHVQCTMGSLSRSSSIMTINSALTLFSCKVVIMVGIAFGVDKKKQKIGDVLIAESIIPYNSKRVGKKDTISRGIESPASKLLLNRFKSAKSTWVFPISEKKKAELIPTRLLSGEELIDNEEYRNSLIAENPESKGGEMEGVGVYAACDGKADWILIKGICDFADGNKGKNKQQRQTLAITSALSLCMEVFSSTSAFKEFGILPYDVASLDTAEVNNGLNDALFDLYDSTKEPYYVERENDSVFQQRLKEYGVWVYGQSGCGKSNLILRNLIHSGCKYIPVSLASCIGQNIDIFFYEILYELSSKTEGITSQIQPKSFPECTKAIYELLNKHYKETELVIFIEEIPISEEEEYKEFAKKLFSLLINKNFSPALTKLRFVLSSIKSPTSHIEEFQNKIWQSLVFMPFRFWEKEDIEKLVSIIEKELNGSIDPEIRQQLIIKSKGSPRFIKKFFRSIKTLEKIDKNTMKHIIAETSRELNFDNG